MLGEELAANAHRWVGNASYPLARVPPRGVLQSARRKVGELVAKESAQEGKSPEPSASFLLRLIPCSFNMGIAN